MNQNTYTEKYNKITSVGVGSAGANDFRMSKSLLIDCGYNEEMSILDYGCGWGSLLTVIHPKDYIGVDISPTMIGWAKERFQDNTFSISEIGSVNVGKKDVIVAHSVFTHMPKNVAKIALKDVVRNLKIAGIAIIDVFHIESWSPTELLHVYTRDDWQDFLKECGLQCKFIMNRQRGDMTHSYYEVRRG